MVDNPLVGVVALFTGQDSDRRSAGRLRAARGGRHHLAEPARHDRAAALGEQASNLLSTRLVFGTAADDRNLPGRHGAMVEIGAMIPVREARGGTLILGGGFAGGYVARLLGERGATIVSLVRKEFWRAFPGGTDKIRPDRGAKVEGKK